MRRAAALLTASVVLATLGVGCVQQAVLPEDCNAASIERNASLTGERLDPEAIDACKGQEVTIKIVTQLGGDLHLHGYEIEVPVEPGDTATFHFTASRAGQFPIELHDEEAGTEAEVGLLTVHEP